MSDNNSIFIGGENNDAPSINSNGSGKSLIFDAVYWCLYDNTVRGFGKDKVIGENDDYTSVRTVWVDDDNRKIEVERYRNHPKLDNDVVVKINGKQASKTKNLSPSGTNMHIAKIFGMTDVAFLYSSIFSKSRLSICDKKPAERIKLLSHIIGLDVIDKGLKLAKKDKKTLTESLHRIDIKASAEKTRVGELKKRIGDVEESIKNAEKRKKRETEAAEVANERTSKKIKSISKKLSIVEKECDKVSELAMAQIGDQEKLKVIEHSIHKSQKAFAKVSVRLEEHTAEYRTSRRSVTATKEKSGTSCPLCKQYIDPSHTRSLLVDLKKDMHVKEKARRKAAKRVHELGNKIKELNQEKIKIESLIDYGLESRILKLELKEKEYKKEIKFLNKNKVEVFESNELPELKVKIDKLNVSIEKSKGNYSKLIEKYKELSDNLSVVEFWINGFGPKGLKRFVINGILDVLEEKTNEYLNEITEGYITIIWEGDEDKESKKVIDQLHLNAKIGNGEKRDYHYCSEGEKARIWLATELALNDIRKITIDVAFVDECFDGLDNQGVQKAIKLITGESMKRKMVCISHRDGVDKFFAKKNTVVMEKGISTLKAA